MSYIKECELGNYTKYGVNGNIMRTQMDLQYIWAMNHR